MPMFAGTDLYIMDDTDVFHGCRVIDAMPGMVDSSKSQV